MSAIDIAGLCTGIALLWALALGLFILGWVRFGARRARLAATIKLDRELDNLTAEAVQEWRDRS